MSATRTPLANKPDASPAAALRASSAAEVYFSRSLAALSKTSNRPFSSGALVKSTPSTGIVPLPAKHAAETTRLKRLHRLQFYQWYFELSTGYNILFYGYGSKRSLLLEFCRTMLAASPVVVVNGTSAESSTAVISNLVAALSSVLKAPASVVGRSVADRANAILKLVDAKRHRFPPASAPIVLLINNIDAPALRSDLVVDFIHHLARHPCIRIVASADSIHAPLLWDAVARAHLQWIHHDLTTFQSYQFELSGISQNLAAPDELTTAARAQHVLLSLTANARTVFRILVEHQLQRDADSERGDTTVQDVSGGLLYAEYLERCRHAFAVSNDATFRMQLVEFRDHQLILSRKMVNGSEVFYVPMAEKELQEVLQYV